MGISRMQLIVNVFAITYGHSLPEIDLEKNCMEIFLLEGKPSTLDLMTM
jgi:hypothetical protein